ncbi:MAG: DNA polymerase III subunit alpha [Streptococcus sp.]|uniref:DNA polymerase III subunit alpha n=1 Tax=Streptococcus sp. TaxID=1306 RepID=UPI0025E750E0|nr:DNA polymerase III subunit alpha [Streptococcus sp.]MBS6654317.1 DNA polymerase III subunit alpha [Streptococcus sp.]
MFAQLDTKSVYSFMDSVVDLPSYVKRAKELGYQALGLMDRDNLYAAYHFAQLATKNGLRPLIGMEANLVYEGRMIAFRLLAKNNQGYKNLMKLATELSSGQGEFTALSNYLNEIALILPSEEWEPGMAFESDVFIGVRPEDAGKEFDYPVLPLHTVRYFDNVDRSTIQMLHAISQNVSLSEASICPMNQLLFSPQEMESAFSDIPDALNNLDQLVSDITYQFDTELKLPRFNRDMLAVDQLRQLAQDGLETKELTASVYQERLDKELAVIHQMGFDDYFLIVWDLLRFGRSRGYYMGMGRGSAAGSLVAYALDITGIDPVKNDLLFERFLNEERYTMPDIDIDLPDIYRSEFLHYVRDRYGSMHSAQIVTFSTFGAKQAIRDVFKRFGAKEFELSQLSKKISFRDNLTSVYKKNMSFRQLINQKPEFQRAFEIAKAIEGQPRQTSIHAAGIVMSDDDLTEHIPLKAGEDMMVTQYDASAVEANGLLKMDFLGLRNLTFVQKMKEKLEEEQGVVIDIKSIDLEDSQTLALFASGKTKGIFQFEQAGAINLLKRIKPSQFEEVVATTSLNRPGASDYIDNFIARKYGKEKVDLIDPVVAPILEPTYGIMLYQEQVMQIAQVFAGFTLGKADLLRRAMSKKDANEMSKMSEAFMSGSQQLRRNPQIAERLFSMMAKFAGYGFNRSHAYAYSALAFQLAYFKSHYPQVFYDVMLNYSSSDYIKDAIGNGFSLARLDINRIPFHDKISDGKIVLGLKTIKGFPRDFALWIIEDRKENGKYVSIEDFLTRIPKKYQKVEVLTPLVHIGLFDIFDTNRQKIIGNLSNLFTFVNELGSLFAESSYSWVDYDDYSQIDRYNMEQELLGVGLSPHPLHLAQKMATHPYQPISDLTVNSKATVLVQLESIRIIRTKKGDQMAFLSVSDGINKLDVTLFPETYFYHKDKLKEGGLFYLEGRTQERDGRIQLVLANMEEASTERFWILLENHEKDLEISKILAKYPGNIPVIIRYQESKETIVSQRFRVSDEVELQKELAQYTLKTVIR